MPSGAKKRKAAKKKNHKGGGGPINHNNTTNYHPSSSSTYSQGEDDSKSQDDRESDAGSPLSQEKNDHEHHHPFDEENVASERTDTPSVASDLTGSQLGNDEDPAGGDIVIKDDERLVEVNSLNMGAVNASATNERKQEEDPSYALSSEASSVIEEKALHSSAWVESHVPEVEKAVVEDDNGSLRVESDPTENAGFEQIMPPVEVEQSLKSSASDDNEEKGIEDACIEKDVNLSFVEGSTQILIAERSADDTNDDVEVNPASKVDWDTPVVPMSDMANSVIDNVQSAEVLEVMECRLGDNEDKELHETSDVNGTLPSVNGKEGKVFPSEEDNLEGKTLTSANEVFPLADENGSKTSLGEVDSVIENEDKVLIVTKEKEGGSVPVADDMIGSSAVAASAAEIAKEAKTKTPGAASVDNVSTVEASDVAVKGNEDTLLKLTDSDTEKAGIDKTKKDISVSAGTQLPVARASGLWALVMSCFGISKR